MRARLDSAEATPGMLAVTATAPEPTLLAAQDQRRPYAMGCAADHCRGPAHRAPTQLAAGRTYQRDRASPLLGSIQPSPLTQSLLRRHALCSPSVRPFEIDVFRTLSRVKFVVRELKLPEQWPLRPPPVVSPRSSPPMWLAIRA